MSTRILLAVVTLVIATPGPAPARADTAFELERLALIARELELAIDLVERSARHVPTGEQHVTFRYDNLAANLRHDRERVLAHMRELHRVPRSFWNLDADPAAFEREEEVR